MIIRLCALATLILIACQSTAQNAWYSFFQDDSLLRNDYYQTSMQKKTMLLNSLGKEYAKDYRTVYEDQFSDIGELWKSSRPITAPEAHLYLQRIVQQIVKSNPELKGLDARVVFSRDWWPNAMSMGDGTIAINAGLVVGLDNEAEMVFVICHEIAHYYLQHTPKRIKQVVEYRNSEAVQREIKRLNKEEYRVNQQADELMKTMSFSSHRHSRENEAEADAWAFHFMKLTGYDCSGIRTCLEKLDHIDDTLFTTPLHLETLFNFPDYAFRPKWVQQESAIFGAMKESDSPLSKKEKDSLKTHPDCSNRIQLLTDSMQSVAGVGRRFIIDSIRFNELKSDFAFEIMEECYRDKNLSRNLYFAISYLRQHPGDQVAIYSIGRALNDLYAYQRDHVMGNAIDLERRGNPAEYNRLLKLLKQIRLSELGEVAFNFTTQYAPVMKLYPGYDQLIRTATVNHQ